MVSTSKILTVSYGTFSCTLEGFDEPFSTMTSIAEYFRDLAADDRYFGAEPPTPDAEMLHQIAEREINRRVEARIETDGIVLRPADAEESVPPARDGAETALLAVPAAAPPVAEPVQIPQVQPEPASVEPPQAAPAQAQDPAPQDAPADYPADSIAAKLQRIRAVADLAEAGSENDVIEDHLSDDFYSAPGLEADALQPEVAPESAEVLEFAPSEEAPAEDQADLAEPEEEITEDLADAPVEADAEVTEIDEPEDVADAMQEDDEVDPNIAEAAPEMLAEEAPVDDEPADAEPAPEIAASENEDDGIDELASEPVEVQEPHAPAGAEDWMPEDETTDEEAQWIEDDVAHAADTDEDDAADENADPSDFEIQDAAAVSTVLGALASDDEAEAGTDLTEPAALADQESDVTDIRDWNNGLSADDDAFEDEFDEDLEDELASDEALADEDDNVFAEDDVEEDVAEADASAPTDDAPEEQAEAPEASDTPTPMARVVKVRRPVAEQRARLQEDMGEGDSMLTPEDEAELMAELEAVERETDPQDEDQTQDQDQQEPAVAEDHEIQPEPMDPAEKDGATLAREDIAVDRILAETNTKLESGEASRRRSAIAHLRAAVQATRADRQDRKDFGNDTLEAREEYQDDLARVVKPRRLGNLEKVTRRLAPLVLVSEQRIDPEDSEQARNPAASSAPVRPRRVTKGNLALDSEEESVDAVAEQQVDEQPAIDEPVVEPQADDAAALAQTPAPDQAEAVELSEFEAFVANSGAQGVAELMEAAAAFETFAEGRPHFSRPQIMKRVLYFGEEGTHSREEALRAFGKLIREGMIIKIKRGQFVISDKTQFRP